MKVILVAGGSGGHIYPCLELAKYFKENGHEILTCGCLNSLEEKIYKENSLEFKGLEIDKHKLRSYLKNRKIIRKIYREYKPDSIILFGNYISVSFGLVAISMSIPIYLHEQNVVYGSANKLLGIKAKKIYLSLPIEGDLYKNKSLLVGNPKSDVRITTRKFSGKNYNVIIVMGSLGSTTINSMLKEFIQIVNNKNITYHIVVGNKYYEDFIKGISIKENIKIYPYLENLSSYIKDCDLFVSRAGATTISEILTLGVCSILIPSPYVKNNHQYKNAKYLLDRGACVLIEEKDLSATCLDRSINELISNNLKKLSIKENALKLATFDSKKKIYKDMVKENER